MTEDGPLEPTAPEPATAPTDAVPTEPVPAAPGPGVPPWPDPAVSRDPARPRGGSTVAVPKWLLLVAGALVIAAIGFGIGYAAAPGGDGGDTRAIDPGAGFVPTFPGNGNGNQGNGNGSGGGSGALPTVPSPGRSRAGFLGVAVSRSTDPVGVRIARVVPDSPATDAGLKVDDVITKVDDKAVTTPNQLANRIGAHNAGDRVTITYVRNGTTDTARVGLKQRDAFELPTPSTSQPQQ
jgi:membrane-associated protease RseP (regulator of RpoE activity)